MKQALGKSAVCTITAFSALPAFAHPGGHHDMVSLAAGFMHPLSGWDHVLAFFALGLWAGRQRLPAQWLLPSAFLLSIAAGMFAGVAGGGIPGCEAALAISVAIAGLLLAFELRLPTRLSVSVMAAIASLHGYVHGVELPPQVSSLSFGVGLLVATALLQLAGLATGAILRGKIGGPAVRMLGAGVAAVGVYLIAGAI